MYIYQADLWCDDCGREICETLDIAREKSGLEPFDASDETSYDSDQYPKGPYNDDEESDTPTHCAAGAECPNGELLDHGKRVGCLIGTLTPDGVKYVLERLTDARASRTMWRAELKAVEQENLDGRSEVVLLWMSHYEIDWPKDLYEIRLDNQGDDPTRITADVQGPYADEWCEAMGSLDGGTWECCDGPTFCYDILTWRPGLIDELVAEGYDLNLDRYGDPDEEEIAIATHARQCDDCQGDYSVAEEHLPTYTAENPAQLKPPGVK